MKNLIDLTIIITLYNNREYIEECLQSISNQTFKSFEVIIVDDGSTDDPYSVIDPFLQVNEQWRYFRHENRGVGYSRNKGIILARGKFISFVDSDDWVDSDYFESLMDEIMRTSSDLVFSNFSKYDENSGVEITDRKDRFSEAGGWSLSERREKVFGGKLFGMACCCVFSSDLFYRAKRRFPVRTFHEDIYVMPYLAYLADKVSHVNSKGYHWRMRSGSQSHSIDTKHIFSVAHALLNAEQFLRENGSYAKVVRSFTTYCIMYLNGLLRRIRQEDGLSPRNKSYLIDLLAAACRKILKTKSKQVLLHSESYHEFVDFYHANCDSEKQIVNSFLQAPIYTCFADVAFFPHKLYHSRTMVPIARNLKELGFSVAFVDMSNSYADEGAYQNFEFSEFIVVKYEEIVLGGLEYSASVFMNDWDTKCALPTITRDNALGIPTFGIVEGIQDFLDDDTGRFRNAYQNVSYLIAAGEHDLQYFLPSSHREKIVGGVPRIAPLLQKPVQFPEDHIALINSNFTYGVLEKERNAWLAASRRAAENAGFSVVITRHPQDRGDLENFKVSADDMYTAIEKSSVLISRFSSAIIESIALGKPVIYFNPKIENVNKFSEPMGAFDVCVSEDELNVALSRLSGLLSDTSQKDEIGSLVRKQAARFLEHHTATGISTATPSSIAQFIASSIARNSESVATISPFEMDLLPTLTKFTASLLLDPELAEETSGIDAETKVYLAQARTALGNHHPAVKHLLAVAASRGISLG